MDLGCDWKSRVAKVGKSEFEIGKKKLVELFSVIGFWDFQSEDQSSRFLSWMLFWKLKEV